MQSICTARMPIIPQWLSENANPLNSLLQLTSHRNPSLPLDLEIPYNDELLVRSSSGSSFDDQYQSDQPSANSNNHRNILVNSYNPNSDIHFRNIITKSSNNVNTNNKNVLSNVYDGNNGSLNRVNNNFTATNQQSNTNSRPNHKTHVEIITKNGPTKKPNIIVNNYNPDLIFANNNPPSGNNNKHHPNNQFPHLYHPHYNSANLNVKNDLTDMYGSKPSSSSSTADRKSTCMLYLQADHTFFQKLGSDEASIEAITRHVQRANVIYKNTGEFKELSSANLIKIPRPTSSGWELVLSLERFRMT